MKKMTVRRAMRKGMQRASWWMQDVRDGVTGRRGPLVPPRLLDQNNSFEGGAMMVNMLRQYAGLQPSHRVLDVGCGIGRIAAPLTDYLSDKGSYVGIDIVKSAVDWMQKAYIDHPSFVFHHLDIHNSAYNPKGKISPDAVVFPFPGEAQFDVVFLISVFTHMYPNHIRHYLQLIERQLKRGGKLFATFFINDDFAQEQQRKALEQRKRLTTRIFAQKTDTYYAPARTNPEAAAAYDPAQLFMLFDGVNLKVDQFIYGNWCGRPNSTEFYQDIITATKM
jgi:SAM-dependent methyltransferase